MQIAQPSQRHSTKHVEREERISTKNRTIEIHIVHCDGLILAGFRRVSRRSERMINGLSLCPHGDAGGGRAFPMASSLYVSVSATLLSRGIRR